MKSILLLLLLTGLSSCQMKSVENLTTVKDATSRVAASANELEEDSTEQHVQTFMNLMNEPDATRHDRIKKFLDRQRSFFYIAQELIADFDARLDEIHKKHQAGGQITAEEFQIFNELRFKNLIAWEFSERNLHEMVDLYRLALENANDKNSIYAVKSRQILSKTSQWFEDGWKNGDRAAIILLAEHFEDVNDEVLKKNKKARVPSLKKYTDLSSQARIEALQHSFEFAKRREITAFDRFIRSRWDDYLKTREDQAEGLFSELYDVRTPQALDALEPDPGPKGHVTGNRFPKGKWAFTFDDGPHATHTQGLLDHLKASGAKVTFFWLTQNMLKQPELVKKVGDLGHSRASHSYSHQNLPTLKPAGLNREIFEALDGFEKVVGKPATMYRCPYGACGGHGSQIRKMIAGRQALEIFWNVDTLDWQDKNPQSVFQRAKKQVDVLGRGLILFHDIHPQSVIASKLLIEYIKSNPQWTIAPLQDLIGESRGKDFASP